MHFRVESAYFKIQYLFLFISLFISVSVNAQVHGLSNEQMQKMMDENIPVIDIRRPDEWKSTGVIPGSHLMTFFDARGKYDLNKWLAKLNKIAGKNDKLILVCSSGNRTSQVARYLDGKLGYTQVYHLEHGINNWIRSGDKVVSVDSVN